MYVTKISIGAEVKVTKDLKVEATNKIETGSSGGSNSENSAATNSSLGTSGGTENTELLNCEIEISESGLITVKDIANLKCFTVVVDNKYVGTTENSTYSISAPAGTKVNVYIIAIDKDIKVYKSNTVEYTGRSITIYDTENKFKSITGDWLASKMSGASYDIENYNYLYMYSPVVNNRSVSCYTQNMIDLTGYTKLKMNITLEDFVNESHNWDGLFYGFTKNIYAANNNHDWMTLQGRTTTEVQNQDIEINISDLEGEYYFQASVWNAKVKINKVWLE